MNLDDQRLIEATLAGQTTAYGELMARYQDRLFNAIKRILNHHEDARDVVQEAFLNAYQALANFKGDAEFFTWLYRIAFNTAISHKRRKKPTTSIHATDPDRSWANLDIMDQSLDVAPDAALQRQEQARMLNLALDKLSQLHRMVLHLKDIDGMKYEEIAIIMDIPIGTVRSRLHRARLELRQLLDPSFSGEFPNTPIPSENH